VAQEERLSAVERRSLGQPELAAWALPQAEQVSLLPEPRAELQDAAEPQAVLRLAVCQ
jgi:hypothetical protein